MYNKTIKEIAADLKNRKYSACELTEYFLNRIAKLDSKINSFITVTAEKAYQQAKIADQKIAQNKQTLLTGIPIAHKDSFYTKNIKTTAGSKILSEFIPSSDAILVKKLAEAGTIMLGKANMDEFSLGSSNEKSFFGPVKNPWDLQKVAGGSSGGSAASIAARLVLGATGTDTGGSIRLPAAFCGITGLKPTYKKVSCRGMIPFSRSLDHVGLLAKSAEDVAILFNAATNNKDKKLLFLNKSLKGLKIGLPQEYFSDNFETGVAIALDEAITTLEKLGAKIKVISLGHNELVIPIYQVITTTEFALVMKNYGDKHHDFRKHSNELGEEVKRRILTGTYISNLNNHKKLYQSAQKFRKAITSGLSKAFQNVDLILAPASQNPAFNLKAKNKNPLNMYFADKYLIPANLAGLPAISLPVGFSENLPVGMQLIGNHNAEAKLLNVAHKYQIETGWHKEIPEGF